MSHSGSLSRCPSIYHTISAARVTAIGTPARAQSVSLADGGAVQARPPHHHQHGWPQHKGTPPAATRVAPGIAPRSRSSPAPRTCHEGSRGVPKRQSSRGRTSFGSLRSASLRAALPCACARPPRACTTRPASAVIAESAALVAGKRLMLDVFADEGVQQNGNEQDHALHGAQRSQAELRGRAHGVSRVGATDSRPGHGQQQRAREEGGSSSGFRSGLPAFEESGSTSSMPMRAADSNSPFFWLVTRWPSGSSTGREAGDAFVER